MNLDDPDYVTGNAVVRAGLNSTGLRWALTSPADYWHPLAWASHMLDCSLFGLAPAGHHLDSVLWHSLNAVLAFLVLRRLTGACAASALAAALFAWHPLRVESVVWISERKDVMSGCFFLLMVLAYSGYAGARQKGRRGTGSYLLALACFGAGLMSKPVLVMSPLILLALDFWPLRRTPPDTVARLFLEKLPFFALAGAAAAATLRMQRQVGAFVLDLPLDARIENALVSLCRYLGKCVWPSPLIVCYGHPGRWPTPLLAASVAFCLALAIAGWRGRSKRPWIAAGLGWYLAALLPVLGLVQAGFQSMADRYTYLPTLGLALAVIPNFALPAGRAVRAAAVGAAFICLAACAFLTWRQEGFWRDSETLFSHAASVDPRNDVAEQFLGSALFAQGRLAQARAHGERALALNPRADQAWLLLAGIDERQGRLAQAEKGYQSALALRPGEAKVQCQLGLVEFALGQDESARATMIPALRSSPDLAMRTLQMGRAALDGADVRAARFLYGLVCEAAPERLRAGSGAADLGRLADLCARSGDFDAAISLYRKATELDPAASRAHAALGYLLIHAGDREGGIEQWRRALELDPAFPGLAQRLRQMDR